MSGATRGGISVDARERLVSGGWTINCLGIVIRSDNPSPPSPAATAAVYTLDNHFPLVTRRFGGHLTAEDAGAELSGRIDAALEIDLLSICAVIRPPDSVALPDTDCLDQTSPSALTNLLFRSGPVTVERLLPERLSKAGPASLVMAVSEVAWGLNPAGRPRAEYAVEAPPGAEAGTELDDDDDINQGCRVDNEVNVGCFPIAGETNLRRLYDGPSWTEWRDNSRAKNTKYRSNEDGHEHLGLVSGWKSKLWYPHDDWFR
ncbi:hypothetical protein OAory_01102870 [Aspergillus oryzae]|uniref:Uncharacterized protein n=1 Tax=Aspergillus oryzae TaxID=5062 RepID=A0A1S9DIV0_ASPOZ|nr:hypothetical protein OAory_01102870 [Aspergillus oryzae]